MMRALMLFLLLAAALGLAAAAIARSVDRREAVRTAQELTGGNVENGRRALHEFGCVACHTIPGIRLARGKVGPRLEGLRERVYIAGVLPNTPENLVWWIQHPQAVDPKTAMPETGIGPVDARHVAAYLYSLD
jgi:cytochrome c2